MVQKRSRSGVIGKARKERRTVILVLQKIQSRIILSSYNCDASQSVNVRSLIPRMLSAYAIEYSLLLAKNYSASVADAMACGIQY